MDVGAIIQAINTFTKKHSVTLSELPKRKSAMLELAAVTGVMEHYRSNGFTVTVMNPGASKVFVIKTWARGNPWNYSTILLKKGSLQAELHMNLVVTGAHDEGRYCADVALVKPGVVPKKKPVKKWLSLPNKLLISFAEVKQLSVYPMLLAQFVGIVHEIQPKFLKRRKVANVDRKRHLPPTLIVLGNYSGNSKHIVESFGKRKLQFHIAENFDMRIAASRKGSTKSPLFWDEEK